MGCDMTEDDDGELVAPFNWCQTTASGESILPEDIIANLQQRSWYESKAFHPSTPDPLAHLEELKPISYSPLQVHADVVDLLEHFSGNQAELFDFLGKLRDLLA